MTDAPGVRNLVIVLGDQLDADSAAFDGFDPAHARPCAISARISSREAGV